MKKAKQKNEQGAVVSLFAGVAKLTGLPSVFLHEVLHDAKGQPAGLVIGFDRDAVEVLLFNERVDTTRPLFRSRETFSFAVGKSIVGRVIDGLGRPIDGLGPLKGARLPAFCEAPPIVDREPVQEPLSTGVKVVDTTLPLGRGQRELIIGDRKLGKSTFAVDVILNQKNAAPAVQCIYVLCGQKRQRLNELLAVLDREGALLYTTVVAAPAESSFGAQYIAPFVGCAIGEYWRDQGKDALIIYDDLSKHAKAYRDIALLLERSPGREAYPGDIFSLHATLLERAAKLSKKKGGGSLTALPIVETQEGDITSFIPTNLISITDGQIYFERGLFQKGFIPAVNVGLSVSRVGSQAQPAALKNVTDGLRLALAQHKELQKLAQLETVKSKEAQASIDRGELLLELLKQDKRRPVSWQEQVVLFSSVEEGWFDGVPMDQWPPFERLFLQFLRHRQAPMLEAITQKGITADVRTKMKKVVTAFKADFLS